MSDTPRRRTRDELLTDLADAVTDLTQPYTHTEQYRIRKKNYYLHRHHDSEHASLLDQLRESVTDRAHLEGEQADSAVPRNTPHVDLDAIDRLDAINRRVAEWRALFGMEPRGKHLAEMLAEQAQQIMQLFPRGMPSHINRAHLLLLAYAEHCRDTTPVEIDLKALVGLASTADARTLVQLEHDVHRYAAWCRIVAGWQKPALQPQARCPQCELPPAERQGLRVRPEIPAAVCLSCDTTWSGAAELAILGEHIRQVREAVDAARRDAIQEAGPIPDPGPRNRGGRG